MQRFDYANRDGPMRIDGNKGSSANYEPNSLEGTPIADPSSARAPEKVTTETAFVID
jgi:catalase